MTVKYPALPIDKICTGSIVRTWIAFTFVDICKQNIFIKDFTVSDVYLIEMVV